MNTIHPIILKTKKEREKGKKPKSIGLSKVENSESIDLQTIVHNGP